MGTIYNKINQVMLEGLVQTLRYEVELHDKSLDEFHRFMWIWIPLVIFMYVFPYFFASMDEADRVIQFIHGLTIIGMFVIRYFLKMQLTRSEERLEEAESRYVESLEEVERGT